MVLIASVEKDVITEEEKEDTFRSKERNNMAHDMISELGGNKTESGGNKTDTLITSLTCGNETHKSGQYRIYSKVREHCRTHTQ